MAIVRYITASTYRHEELGVVHIRTHATSQRLTARWRGVELYVTVPGRCTVEAYEQFISNNIDRLLEMRPKTTIQKSRFIDGNFADFTIKVGTLPPDKDLYVDFITSAPERNKLCNTVITVNSTLVEKRGLDDAALIKFVNSAIVYAAKACTRRYIVPHAAALARGLGLEPKKWSVRDTKRQYGSCSASGEISLSARLIFLPAELRDFIIYHELAHMTEMNHSDAFHRLCDSYCGGREREFESRLRAFKSPVF